MVKSSFLIGYCQSLCGSAYICARNALTTGTADPACVAPGRESLSFHQLRSRGLDCCGNYCFPAYEYHGAVLQWGDSEDIQEWVGCVEECVPGAYIHEVTADDLAAGDMLESLFTQTFRFWPFGDLDLKLNFLILIGLTHVRW
jgi:hypothetical protein